MQHPLAWGLNVAEAMLLALSIGTFYTLAKALARTGKSGHSACQSKVCWCQEIGQREAL
jgi:hypothetical protein